MHVRAFDESESISVLSLAELVRHIAVVGLSGALAGAVFGGVGGRLLMRIAAMIAPDRVVGRLTENGNRIGDFTVSGTTEILVFSGLLMGGIGAVAYVVAEPWLSWSIRWRPLLFGLFILAIGAPTVLEPDNVDFRLVGSQELIIGMFLTIFLLYGVTLVSVIRLLDRHLPGVNPDRPIVSTLGYLAILAFGFMIAPALFFMLFSEDACGCEPNYFTGSFLVSMAVLTVILWIIQHTIWSASKWIKTVTVIGYGALVGALSSGSFRTWSDIKDICSARLPH